MESSLQIEERAAQWLAKRDSDRWTDSDEAEFNVWFEQSTLHVVAFVRLEAAWNQAKRLKALSAGVEPGTVPSPEAWQLAPFFERSTQEQPLSSSRDSPNNFETFDAGTAKPASGTAVPAAPNVPAAPSEGTTSLLGEEREGPIQGRVRVTTPTRRVRFSIAASLVLAIGASLVVYFRPFNSTYSTPVGGIAAVPMSDGSKVTLNTNSQIRVDVTDSERNVQLEQGEAFFEVAKDPTRPFVVNAGKSRVVALGTKFSVRREGNEVRVFVTEGKVRFEDASSPLYQSQSGNLTPRSAVPRSPVPGEGSGEAEALADFQAGKILLTAGNVARASGESVLVQEKSIPEIETYLSWRTGYLIFRDMPLSDAIAEFNRYNTKKIVIDDPAIEAIRISGKFRSTQFEAFVRLLEDGLPIHVQRADDRIILTDSRDTRAQGTAASP